MPGLREPLGHVARMDLGPENPVRQPHAPAALLDRHLSKLALPLAHHPEQLAVGGRVDTAAEAMLADYASHGVGTSSEEASLRFPDFRVKDSPDAGDQRSEGPVASDDDLTLGLSKSC